MNLEDTQTNAVSADFVRLSRWSILHFTARSIMQIVSNAFALVPMIYGLYKSDSVMLTIAVVGGGIFLIVLSATLRYLYFSYLIQDSSVQVKEGVFAKKHLNLHFQRVQNVNIEHPFYFRPLGLVTVKIDGAGSAGEEVSLAALPLERGEGIREEIRRHGQSTGAAPGSGSDAPEAPSAPASTLILTRSLTDLVIHGLTNNRAWIILGAVGAAYGQVAENVNAFIAGLGIDLGGFMSSQSVIALVALGISALMLALVIVAGLSVLGSIFTYYNYQLYGTDEAFMVRRGLLTRHEINVKKSRIQAVRVRRDWLDMILGRMNVVFEQISHAVPGQASGLGSDKHIMVPSVEPVHTDMLTQEALSAEALAQLEFTPVSYRYFKKRALIVTALFLGLGTFIVKSGFPLGVLLLAPLLALNLFLLYMSWKRWGLAINDGMVVIRKGVIGVDHILLPAFKIQEVRRVRTPFMRRRGLSSVSFSVASTQVRVPHLPNDVVRGAINFCLYETESADRSWM